MVISPFASGPIAIGPYTMPKLEKAPDKLIFNFIIIFDRLPAI